MKNRVIICETCAKNETATSGVVWAKQLSKAVADSSLNIDVVTTTCLNMCDTPLSFALQGDQKATYLFSGADPQVDTQDMIGLLKLYVEAPDGWIEDAQNAGRLRLCLQGRVPKF